MRLVGLGAVGFIYLAAVVDWLCRQVLSWRISISLDADFCVEALEGTLAQHGQPEIFNMEHGRAIGLSGHAMSRQSIRFDRVHQGPREPEDPDQHGRQGSQAR